MKNLNIIIFLVFLYSHSVEAIIFIVNENNPIRNMTKEQIAHMYLKKNREWPNGSPVRFFDHTDESKERAEFLQKYLSMNAREIEEYWIGQKLYTGNSAPSQLSSDQLMKSMVTRFPGAIGYVNDDFSLNSGIKKVNVGGN